ncbi:hypothetical protein [Listeria ilorinensis]|uniref:hypothetical protein n=1 Tax=Listeria ilorinensis TaxID=2867439 RepID=UPI001EF45286|nr:hypothetical protein [Listeria ilorinensis]
MSRKKILQVTSAKKMLAVLLGVATLFMCSPVSASAVDRYGVFLDRNYENRSLTLEGPKMAAREFSNQQDPYRMYQIIDWDKSKADVINGLNYVFRNAKDDDINYLVIESHGYNDGIIDFTFQELRTILDRYRGHFVISLFACDAGGSIDKMKKNFVEAFKKPIEKSGEFKNSRYNVFCSSSKDQLSYFYSEFAPFTKAFFDSAQKVMNGNFLNADYNHDNVVTSVELDQFLRLHGQLITGVPVSQIVEPNLPIFAVNRNQSEGRSISSMWTLKAIN